MQGVLGHSANVVTCLVKAYFGTGHPLFMDNYYNSVALCEVLPRIIEIQFDARLVSNFLKHDDDIVYVKKTTHI